MPDIFNPIFGFFVYFPCDMNELQRQEINVKSQKCKYKENLCEY